MQGRKYIINGNPNKPLIGEVECLGAKNVAVKALLAALLTRDKTILRNLPNIGDTHTTKALLESIKVKCTQIGNTFEIDPSNVHHLSDLKIANRTSISLFAILSHFTTHAQLPIMDGCSLGARSVDFHFHIYEKFGIELITHPTFMEMKKPEGKLKGQIINLPYPSVGATDTALFLAVLAEGKTIVDNIATEPEVLELISMLQMMGAQIIFKGPRTIEIYGVEKLHGLVYDIMPDRLEIVSWAVLAAISNGSILVKGIKPTYLHTFLGYYQKIGGGVEYLDNNIVRFYKDKPLQHSNVSTAIYPSLATDQLAQLSIMLGLAEGISTLHETVYENRINVIAEMLESFGIHSTSYTNCLGEQCRFAGHNFVHSMALTGQPAVNAPKEEITLPKNIRCAHSYILIASQAEGITTLYDPSDSVNRGYGDAMVEKMRKVGIKITQTVD